MLRTSLRMTLTMFTYLFNIENVLKDVLEHLSISNIKVTDILKHRYLSLNISDVLEDTFTKY